MFSTSGNQPDTLGGLLGMELREKAKPGPLEQIVEQGGRNGSELSFQLIMLEAFETLLDRVETGVPVTTDEVEAARKLALSERSRLEHRARDMDDLMLLWETQKNYRALANYASMSVAEPTAAELVKSIVLSAEPTRKKPDSNYRSSPDADLVLDRMVERWREEEEKSTGKRPSLEEAFAHVAYALTIVDEELEVPTIKDHQVRDARKRHQRRIREFRRA